MMLVFAALLEQGDEVIISDPGYACYPNFVSFLGGVPVRVPVYEADGFEYRPEAIAERITAQTKAIIVNSPSNPTGNLLSKNTMRAVAGLSPYVVSTRSITAWSTRKRALHTGVHRSRLRPERLFQALCHDWTAPGLSHRARAFHQAHPEDAAELLHLRQFAGATRRHRRPAGDRQDVSRMKQIYNERRQFMIKRLKNLGFGITVPPTGAFYVFANAGTSAEAHINWPSTSWRSTCGSDARDRLRKQREGYLRFSYANSLQNIAEGLDRIEQYLKDRQAEPI